MRMSVGGGFTGKRSKRGRLVEPRPLSAIGTTIYLLACTTLVSTSPGYIRLISPI